MRTRRPTPRPGRRLAALVTGVALVATACGGTGDEPATVDLDGATPVAALETFDSCEALLGAFRAEALDRVGPWGWQDGPVAVPLEDEVFAEGDDGTARSPAPAESGTDPSVSGTNVQEEGVDEPDLVKASADRMVVVGEGRLSVIDLTADPPEVVGRLTLPGGFDHELLVAGDTALVMSTGDDVEPRFAEEEIGIDGARYVPTTLLTQIDLSDPAAPGVVRSLRVQSAYLSARLQGDVARVVLSRPAPDLGFVYPSGPDPAAEERARRTNRAVVEESTLDDWLPAWSLDGDGSLAGRLDDCAAVHHPSTYAGLGLTSVLTVDLAAGLGEPEAVSIVGDGQTVYAAPDHLYVATERPAEPVPDSGSGSEAPEDETIAPPPDDLRTETSIHRFRAGSDGPVDYQASGRVEGRLLNQFALSEHDDVLRVATTRGGPWADDTSDSLVTTLVVEGDRLVERGRVEDLGRGEQIFAVRFIGPLGYVVTFRQTDPLYVVDLRDPSAPTVEGELKILGYSAYLHPVDDTHLLGVGQDADESGRTRGAQLSLFDVGDPAAPRRTAQLTLPDGSSEVEWDHRAFLWWGATGTAVLPVETYRDLDGYTSQALVVDADPGGSLTERGRVDHRGGQVRRSVILDDTLLTVGPDRVLVSRLDDLTPVADLAL